MSNFLNPHSIRSLSFILFFLATISKCNFILTVTSTSYTVNDLSNVTINIRTTTTISTLDIVLYNLFGVSSPFCRINGTVATCNQIIPATGNTVSIRYSYAFAANTNYTLSFNITNPAYSDSFSIQALNGAIAFSNTGTLTIIPKNMACSMTSTSSTVSQSANITINIGVSTMSAGTNGQLSLSVNSQTIFPNVINTSPTCLVDNVAASCSLGLVFGYQILSVNPVNVGIRTGGIPLAIIVSSMRNSPYNSSFESITVSVLDSVGRSVEQCVIRQPAASTLQQSNSLSLQGWNSLVGQLSNVQFLLSPFFIPLNDLQIILVYPNTISINPKAPATFTSSSTSTLTYLKISNITFSSLILSFNATFLNPISTIPLYIASYILYNDTLFRQQKLLSSDILTLQKQTLQIVVNLGNPITLVQTTINFTMRSPIDVTNGFQINVTVTLGQFICANIGLSSNLLNLTITNCNSSKLYLTCSSQMLTGSNYWISANYLTHLSIAPNTLTIDMASLKNYSIMSGSSLISIYSSQPQFTVISSNTTYTAVSNYTIIQANVTELNDNIIRIITITPPAFVKFSETCTAISINATSTILSSNLDIATNKFSLLIQGNIWIRLLFVINPGHYLGGRQWTINCVDSNGFISSASNAIHTPQYSPARSSITQKTSNSTIQQLNNITLTIQPLLQYNILEAPTLLITFSASSINRVNNNTCPNCVMLTSTKLSIPYYSVVMRPVIQIVNNRDPNNNQVSFSISISDFIFQVGSITYQLDPLLFQLAYNFNGLFANLGKLQISIISILSTPVTINYTGTSGIFSSAQQCTQCNSTYLLITGIVGYFITEDVILSGYSNDTLYARGSVRISYTCSQISGCQICEPVNSTVLCTRCFTTQFSSNYLLYRDRCYSACPAETYANGAVCSACPHLCYKCTADQCQECVANYYLYLSSCVQQCPPLYIKNATHCLERPVICPTNCIDCPSDNACQKCDAGFYLLENLCYTSCPSSYIADQTDYTCTLFIPPAETKYFPFAFYIASILILILLRVVQCFEKRSLVMGNFIAISSLLQIGAMVMMISYTFISITQEPDRWISNNKLLMQGLIFIIVLTKVILNFIFLVYFLRKISHDQNFQNWLEKSTQHKKLYITLLVFSTIFSFQIMRLIYCRFLGLQLFFGRFNTSTIFKPINFFSLAYIVPGGGLIVMAIFDIIMQNGYRTSIFYSSIEVILIQIVITIACIFQACRSDKEYFDYQIYKVQNQSDQSNSASKVKIIQQQEAGGSFNQMLIQNDESKMRQPVGYSIQEVGGQTAGKIIRNKLWRQKKAKLQNISNVLNVEQDLIKDKEQNLQDKIIVEQIQTLNQQQNSYDMLKLSSGFGKKDKAKERSIFRNKILQEWQELRKKLPQPSLHRILSRNLKSHLSKSLSPQKRSTYLKKNMSSQKIQKIQITMPIPSFKNKKKLKNYFYKIIIGNSQLINQQKNNNGNEKSIQKEFDQKSIQKNNNYDVYGQNTDFPQDAYDTEMEKQAEGLSEIQNNNDIEQQFEKSLMELRKDIKAQRYEDFDNQIIQQEQDRQQISKNKDLILNSQYGISLKKLKKRNVNKKTQAVYLQRLVSSSETYRPKPLRRQKLQDF